MAGRLQGVIVDLDDTLYEYAPCNRHGVKTVMKFLSNHYAMPYQKCIKLFFKARSEVKDNLPNNASSHSRLLYFKRLVEKIEGRTNPAFVLKLEKLFWDSYFKKMRLRKNAKEFLKQCRQKKLRIAIVTNLTAGIQLEKISKLGLGGLIDFVVTSEEAGVEKPDVKMVEFALKASGLKKNSVVFLGDQNDIAAAKKAKILFIPAKSSYDLAKAAKKIKKML